MLKLSYYCSSVSKCSSKQNSNEYSIGQGVNEWRSTHPVSQRSSIPDSNKYSTTGYMTAVPYTSAYTEKYHSKSEWVQE